jgi:hypothetical protein
MTCGSFIFREPFGLTSATLRSGSLTKKKEMPTMNLATIRPVLLILLVTLVVATGVALWMYIQKERTRKLRSRFGPEYEIAVAQSKDRVHAESELQKRTDRVAEFHIQPLKTEDRSRFTEDWRREQSRFVDDPQAAVNHVDTLVQDVMQRRGYPVGDFEQNAADLSVDHPRVVENYRAAHEIALREGKGVGNTEDLRKAMVSYRVLFEDLLVETVDKPEEVRK